MKYICYKGCHWFLPVIPRFYWKRKKFSWECSLDDSCKYNIGDEQLDWNKLVGVSNKLNPRIDSVRFVWRYNLIEEIFEIGLYIEKNYKFESYSLIKVKPNEKFNVKLIFFENYLIARANKNIIYLDYKIKNFTYRLNPYFGGNMSAPHKMFLTLK